MVDINFQPAPNIAVALGAKTTTSAEDGTFMVEEVTPPYDVAIIVSGDQTGDGIAFAMVFKGLMRTDPTLQLYGFANAEHSADLDVTVTGGLGDSTSVVFGSPEAPGSVPAEGDPTGRCRAQGSSEMIFSLPSYAFSCAWFGPAATTGTLHALRWEEDVTTQLPLRYVGYAATDMQALAPDGTFNLSTTLGTISEGSISGTVQVAADHTIAARYVDVNLGARATMEPVADSSGTTNFSYKTPVIPGATLTLVVEAAAAEPGRSSIVMRPGLSATESIPVVDVPAAPKLGLPIEGAGAVDPATVFQWTGAPDAGYLVVFRGIDPSHPELYVLTTELSTTIPDLASVGGPVAPAGAIYEWLIIALGPIATPDDGADEDGYWGPFGYYSYLFPRISEDSWLGFSEARTFTVFTPP